jgi:hypothetical protein
VKAFAHSWAWLVLGLLGCAAGAPLPSPPATPKTQLGAPSLEPNDPKAPVGDELSRLLLALAPPKSVLSVLPQDIRTELETRVNRLKSEQKRALLDPSQPFAYQRPLLHFVAGGNAIGASTALFASAVAADELGEARQPTGQFDDLPALVTQIASLAAQQVLVRRAGDVAPGKPREKSVLGEIAAAADFLNDDTIYLAALDALARAYPDPEWSFMRAGALARNLKPAEARVLLPQDGASDVTLLRAAETLIKAAEQAAELPQTLDQAVATARAMLVLDREADAIAAMAPYRDKAPTHLGLAATLLRAEAGSGPCPELHMPLGTAGLCRLTWQRFLTPERLAIINQAWQSGAGRDVEGADVWLGLSHVVPMMYGLQQTPEQALGNLVAFRDGAKAATQVDARYHGVTQLATTLELGLRASLKPSDGATPEIAKAERIKLLKGASQLVRELPDESWSQAAALGTLAVLLPHEEGGEVLARLSERIRPEWRITHASLLLWNLLSKGAAKEFSEQKDLLGQAAQTSGEGSYARSRWVILWAEAEAHLEPSDKTYAIVNELAQRLKDKEVPLDLRLRTALDVAGLKGRQGDWTSAIDVLAPVVADTPRASVTTRMDQELLIAATGYELTLRALSTRGEEQAKHIEALGQLADSVAKAAAAPPVLMMWLVLWKGELDALAGKATCSGNVACEQRALKARGIGSVQFEKVVGPRMAAMLRHGVLPIGGVDLELRYRGGKLMPQVDVDPAFLLVHMPTLDGKVAAGR